MVRSYDDRVVGRHLMAIERRVRVLWRILTGPERGKVPTRRHVLEALRARGRASVKELAQDLGMSRAIVKAALLRGRPGVVATNPGVGGRGRATIWRCADEGDEARGHGGLEGDDVVIRRDS